MVTIITALVSEHRAFCAEFDRVEQVLPRTRKLEAVKLLAQQVEGMLVRHAAAEEDLLLLARGRRPEQKQSQSETIHLEHLEIDARLTQVHLARNLAQARRLFQAAIAVSRRHFKHEERMLFPMIEQVMDRGTLAKLGTIWTMRKEGRISLLASERVRGKRGAG
jgi:hypothetical protein